MEREKEIDLDGPLPETEPDLSLGDLIRWAPVLKRVVTDLEKVLAGQETQIPAVKIKFHGKHLTLGPCPIAVD